MKNHFPHPNSSNEELLDKNRSAIRKTEERARSRVFDIIYSNSLFVKEALARNKAIIASVKEDWEFNGRNPAFIEAIEKTIAGIFDLFEKNNREIIKDCFRQIKEVEKFNRERINATGNVDMEYSEKMLKLIVKTFKARMSAEEICI